ncbi:MAG: peptidase P60, partial [Pseudomonadota bacterium]
MTQPSDPRLTPARPDLAAAHLRGTLEAARFVEGRGMTVAAPLAPLRRAPAEDAPLDTECLFGETVTVYDTAGGWAWVQCATDGYVGYLPDAALAPGASAPATAPAPAPTHRVATAAAHLYAAAGVKVPVLARLPWGARVTVLDHGPAANTTATYARLRLPDGREAHAPSAQLAPLDQPADWVSEAAARLGVPYLWGGRSGDGL